MARIDDYMQENPNVYISDADYKLALKNERFADDLIEGKTSYYTAQQAGDEAGMMAAHRLVEGARMGFGDNGGYSGGDAGDKYIPLGSRTTSQFGFSGGGGGGGGGGGYLQNAYDSARAAQRAATEAAIRQYQAQIPEIRDNYRDARTDAYTYARTTALGNNEALAAMGLAGSAYTGPTSGYSETSRVRQDTALGSALNRLTADERKALAAIENAIIDARLKGDAAMAGLDNTYALKFADAQRYDAEQEYKRYQEQMQNELKMTQYQSQYQSDADAAAQKAREQEYKNAYNLWTKGVTTPEIAAILGLGEGVLPASYMPKAATAASSSSSSKSASSSAAAQNEAASLSQIANYQEIKAGLMGSFSNPYDALRYVDNLGADFYISLVGKTLYDQLVKDLNTTKGYTGK